MTDTGRFSWRRVLGYARSLDRRGYCDTARRVWARDCVEVREATVAQWTAASMRAGLPSQVEAEFVAPAVGVVGIGVRCTFVDYQQAEALWPHVSAPFVSFADWATMIAEAPMITPGLAAHKLDALAAATARTLAAAASWSPDRCVHFRQDEAGQGRVEMLVTVPWPLTAPRRVEQ